MLYHGFSHLDSLTLSVKCTIHSVVVMNVELSLKTLGGMHAEVEYNRACSVP